MTTHLSPFSQNKKSTNVRTFDMIGQKVNTWLERRRDRRRLASMDARALRDLGIDPAQAEFEAARKPWQEETGLGKDIEIGIDCPPRRLAGRQRRPVRRDARDDQNCRSADRPAPGFAGR